MVDSCTGRKGKNPRKGGKIDSVICGAAASGQRIKDYPI